MAISLASNNDYLLRSATYFNVHSSFTVMGWGKQGSSTPSGGAFRTYYNYGDGTGVNPYIYLGSDSDSDNIRLAYYDGVNYIQTTLDYTPITGIWFHWTIRYDSTTHELDFIINASIIETLTIDLSTITFTTQEESVAGNWIDFIFSNIGVNGNKLTLHQILIQSRFPAPRYYRILSYTTLSGWQPSSSFIDNATNSHPWILHGTYNVEVSPHSYNPLPFDTIFDDNYDAFTLPPWSFSSPPPYLVDKPTQGCNYGNVYTSACNSSILGLYIAYPPDYPTPAKSAVPVQALSLFAILSAYSTIGNVPAVTTAPIAIGVDLFQFNIAQDTLGTGQGYAVLLVLQSGGTLAISVCNASNLAAFTNFTSAPNAFPIDGLAHGIQVSLNYTSATNLVFKVYVDNVLVINNSYNNAGNNLGASGTFGINEINIRNTRDSFSTGFFTSFDRIRVVANPAIVSWDGCSSATALTGLTPTAYCALPERIIPTGNTGMYKIVNGSLKSNDTLYTSLVYYSVTYSAIPQPLVITGFMGDEK